MAMIIKKKVEVITITGMIEEYKKAKDYCENNGYEITSEDKFNTCFKIIATMLISESFNKKGW